MADCVHALLHSTIGDLIKRYRVQANLTISSLGNLSGVSKGVISKIENGDTKLPELKTVKAISRVLDIPYQQIVEHYIEIEQRVEALLDLLTEVIQLSNTALASKVSSKFLESPREYTYTLIERLYTFILTIEPVEFKVLLYETIIKYARERGEPHYLAKSLLQKYLIERQNLKRLEETYKEGEEILHYIKFLSQEEKVTFYYRMSLHAHALKKYEDCIRLGKAGHDEDMTTNELKERIALAICNSYLFSGNYKDLEEHLQTYERLNYSFIINRVKFFRAIVLSRTGKYHQAIPLLRECVEEVTDHNRLTRINMLLEALIMSNDLPSIEQMLALTNGNLVLLENDPYYYYEIGRYYSFKANFLVKSGLFDEGMEAYISSIQYFGKISDYKSITLCTEEIYSSHITNGKSMKLELLGKLQEVYNIFNNYYEKGDQQ